MPDVVRLREIDSSSLIALVEGFGLAVAWVEDDMPIPGSHWGDEEAGLIKNTLYCRSDTPVHSVLHEACHWILMDPFRREILHTDAGGSSVEENAVCYLQIVLSDRVPDIQREIMFRDMDSWGYSFRLGSARDWFLHDAADAKAFLQNRIANGRLKLE